MAPRLVQFTRPPWPVPCTWLGRRRGRTHPNPPVGAVVVGNDGTILGEGATQPAGGHHAEILALRAAGPKLKAPHWSSRWSHAITTGGTPPCTEAILLRRNPLGNRSGDETPIRPYAAAVSRLSAASTEFAWSRLVSEHETASAIAQGHFKLASETGRPHITAKWATTEDGKVARDLWRWADHRGCRMAASPRNAERGRRDHHRRWIDSRGRLASDSSSLSSGRTPTRSSGVRLAGPHRPISPSSCFQRRRTGADDGRRTTRAPPPPGAGWRRVADVPRGLIGPC